MRKIISNRHSSLLHETGLRDNLEDEILYARFPHDIVRNKDEKINIALTLSVKEKSFARLQDRSISFTPNNYDKDLRVSAKIKEKVNIYDSITNIKKVNDVPSGLDIKSPGVKESFFGGSLKNFIESSNVNLQHLHYAASYKIEIRFNGNQ